MYSSNVKIVVHFTSGTQVKLRHTSLLSWLAASEFFVEHTIYFVY
jgi:hypothetical protein